jgi:cobalt-zinc-cadmium efflux system outer membrane protein
MQLQFLRPKYLQLSFQCVFIILLLMGFNAATIAAEAKESAGSLTLQDALNMALQANPDIAVALREREAIEGIKMQAAVRPNPSISTTIQDARRASRETTLEFSQELELGNKRSARMEAADLFVDKATAKLDRKKAEVHANVVTTFYEVLAAQERLGLAKSSVEIAELALDAAAKRVKAGKSAPVEETKSRIAESTAKIELNQTNSHLNNWRRRLSALWGNTSPTFNSAAGSIIDIPTIVALSELSAMLNDAPAIKLAKAEVNARDAVIQIERSKATPNITISAGVVNNQELGRNQALLGFSLPIPLFDRNQGNLQEAVSRKYKAQDALIALKSRLEVNLSNQYQRFETARQASESLHTKILPNAQSAFDAANKGFIAGKFNFLDMLDAQRTLFQAKSQYVQSLLEAHQAMAEIERILGDVISHQEN